MCSSIGNPPVFLTNHAVYDSCSLERLEGFKASKTAEESMAAGEDDLRATSPAVPRWVRIEFHPQGKKYVANTESCDLYSPDDRLIIWMKIALHAVFGAALYIVAKTAYHLVFPVAMSVIAWQVSLLCKQQDRSFDWSYFAQRCGESFLDIVRTPLYGIAIWIVEIGAALAGPIATLIDPHYLFECRALRGRLLRQLHRSDHMVLPTCPGQLYLALVQSVIGMLETFIGVVLFAPCLQPVVTGKELLANFKENLASEEKEEEKTSMNSSRIDVPEFDVLAFRWIQEYIKQHSLIQESKMQCCPHSYPQVRQEYPIFA